MKHKPHRTQAAELKMTPMIDVIFLLLVFFVCTANFVPPQELLPMDTTLPGNVAADIVLPDLAELDVVLIRIAFDAELHWQIEGNQFSSLHDVQNLLRLIQSIKPDVPVVIESADNVPIENVIDVYDICRRVGLMRIQFAAD